MTDTDSRLDTLARADAARLKAFAEGLVGLLDEIEVIHSRTGLVMLPMRDTAQGTAFHLGEVLVSEAHIRSGQTDGYGMRQGHDLEASMAMALVDLGLQSDALAADCLRFCETEAATLQAADEDRLRRIEATRVDMETF